MIDVLSHLHQYVPFESEEEEYPNPENEDEEIKQIIDKLFRILLGGDQLTVERANGSKLIRSNECRASDRLEGLVPVVEDEHSKVCLLKIYIKLLKILKY